VSESVCNISDKNVKLLIDMTGFDANISQRVIVQENFKEILSLINKQAKTFIYADFFLWNNWQDSIPENYRKLSTELADALIHKKYVCSEITILILTDPINRAYGNMESEFYHRMADAGIAIVFTELSMLRDSNILYSIPARVLGKLCTKIPCVKEILNKQIVPNLLNATGENMSLYQLGQLLFFKANHRKLIIADTNDRCWKMIVTSFNPADNSSAHSNCGLLVSGDIAHAALKTELACVKWSV
jgi:hypothetical protein